jgi:hypothetical protein
VLPAMQLVPVPSAPGCRAMNRRIRSRRLTRRSLSSQIATLRPGTLPLEGGHCSCGGRGGEGLIGAAHAWIAPVLGKDAVMVSGSRP